VHGLSADRLPEAIAEPISAPEFSARLDPLMDPGSGPVAVAVSGGADSTALLHLADAWARKHARPLLVYTVDHRLRPDAADEALRVACLAATLGRSHRTLAWVGDKPSTGLQAAARTARYRLLLAACRRDRAEALLLAHHLDDQAETLLHRIDRGTGPDGMAGMQPARRLDGVLLLRPLLDLPKARLVATCRAAGLAWSEDPSNDDRRFARTGLRRLAPALAEAGITPDRLGRLAAAMAVARATLDRFAAAWMAAHADVRAAGDLRLDRAALLAAAPTLRHRLVDHALRAVGGAAYPARGARLARLLEWIAAAGSGSSVRTLGGCRVTCDGGEVLIVRDWRGAAPPVVVGPRDTGRWDGRFDIDNPTDAPVRVGVCGEEGWRRWRRRTAGTPAAATPAGLPAVSHAARLALPAVVDLDGGIVLPHLVPSALTPSGWVGDAVRIRFRPSVSLPSLDRCLGAGNEYRPSLPCNGRQAT